MTLAAVFLVVIFSAPSAPPLVAEHPIASRTTPASVAPATAANQDQAIQDQATTDPPAAPSAQNPPPSSKPPSTSASPTPVSPSQTPPAVKRSHHKKRVHPANCGSMPAPTVRAASGSTQASGDPTPSGTAPAPAVVSSSTNCPPPKVIVRQGGTSEPSIQLAGGAAAGQTSNQRDTANQMLDATEANLKKLAGKQLAPNEQDMVSQTRQFIQQSKAAVEAGDLERARTLAWKAQVLSEELVKPAK
jgi:hypothetical protein